MSRASRSRPIVAIDGPAGAGKSTVAKRLAKELELVLVDTGALYRTLALAAQRAGLAWTDANSVAALARSLVARRALRFERDQNGDARVQLAGEDVTVGIRTPDIGMGASTVSAHADVRAALLDLQRQAGLGGGVVLEGRDIGTVVFPDADFKFFLTARPEIRAKRRFEELAAKGISTTFDETLIAVLRRDEQDTARPVAPLRQAPDAVLVDSSEMTVEQAVESMLDRVRAWRPR